MLMHWTSSADSFYHLEVFYINHNMADPGFSLISSSVIAERSFDLLDSCIGHAAVAGAQKECRISMSAIRGTNKLVLIHYLSITSLHTGF